METLAGRALGELQPGRLLHQPRGAAPGLRAGADPAGAAPRRLVQPDAPTSPGSAMRTRDARRRARRVLPRHRQPDRREGRPGDRRPSELRAPCSTSSIPANEPGRLTLIHRFGAGRIDGAPAAADRGRARARGKRVLWCCDPMHGNTITHRERRQDPPLRRHPRRARTGLRHPRSARLDPRRRPLRADRRERHRVHRRRARPRPKPTSAAPTAATSIPRLNYEQALEMALAIARRAGAGPRRPGRLTTPFPPGPLSPAAGSAWPPPAAGPGSSAGTRPDRRSSCAPARAARGSPPPAR